MARKGHFIFRESDREFLERRIVEMTEMGEYETAGELQDELDSLGTKWDDES